MLSARSYKPRTDEEENGLGEAESWLTKHCSRIILNLDGADFYATFYHAANLGCILHVRFPQRTKFERAMSHLSMMA